MIRVPKPPWLAARLVRWALPSDVRRHVLHDLEEDFLGRCDLIGRRRADRWYWRQAVGFGLHGLSRRIRRRRVYLSLHVAPSKPHFGMSHMMRDVLHTFRDMRRHKMFTVAAVGCLSLGMGANIAFFSLFRETVLNPLKVPEPNRLVTIFQTTQTAQYATFSFADYVDLRAVDAGFQDVAARYSMDFVVSGNVAAENVVGELVSTNYFDVAAVQPAAGRFFRTTGEDVKGQPAEVVLSHRYWASRFGKRPDVIGTSIRVNGTPMTIVGVAPERFRGMTLSSMPNVWVPLMMYNQVATGFFASIDAVDYVSQRAGIRRFRFLTLFGRLAAGSTTDQALVRLQAANARLVEADPTGKAGSEIVMVASSVSALPMWSRTDLIEFLLVIIASVGLVLVVACANLASLLIARADARRRETAIRIAIGAGRGRLIAQWLTESVLLSALSGVAGLAVAWVIVQTLGQFRLPGGVVIGSVPLVLDLGMLAVIASLSVSTALLFGLGPALHAARTDTIALVASAKAESKKTGLLRDGLLTGQVALSFVVLYSAGLFSRALMDAMSADLGFEASQTLSLSVDLGGQIADSPTASQEERAARQGARATEAYAVYQAFVDRVGAFPSVTQIGVTDSPFGRTGLSASNVYVQGRADPIDVEVQFASVNADFFEALQIPIRTGSTFGRGNDLLDPNARVITEGLARRLWPNEDAIGKRFTFSQTVFADDGPTPYHVVGVVSNLRQASVDDRDSHFAFRAIEAAHTSLLDWPVTFLIRSTASVNALLTPVMNATAELDPNLAFTDVMPYADRVNGTLQTQRMGMFLLGGLAFVALVVAAIGVFGSVSYRNSQRLREFGIRLALGATPGRVARGVLGRGVLPVVIGVVVGIPLSAVASKSLEAFVRGVPIHSADLYVFNATAIVVVAIVASWVPARRGAKTDPVRVLAQE